MPNIEVSIEQNDCTSCGLCPEIDSDYFFMSDANLAHVKNNQAEDPKTPEYNGIDEAVEVAEDHEDLVIEAAEECPGECIHVSLIKNAVQVEQVSDQLITA